MVSPYASHRLRNTFGQTVAIAGILCAGAGVIAFIGILYLANFTTIIPLNDAFLAPPVAYALEACGLLLGIIALPLLRFAPGKSKVFAWITVGTSLAIAETILAVLFALSAFSDG